jgi:putative transposase
VSQFEFVHDVFYARVVLMITHKVRLKATSGRYGRLQRALDHTRDLYNAGLEERISAWRSHGFGITKYDQFKSLTTLHNENLFDDFATTMQRWPLSKLHDAFQSFFKRLKKGGKAGFPRFRSEARFDTFGFSDRGGWSFDGRSVTMKGIGRFRVHLHRPVQGEIRSLMVKREGRKWFALIGVRIESSERHATGTSVGLDMGTTHLATLSTGEHLVNIRTSRRLAPKVAEAQRVLARAKRASKRRKRVKERLLRLKRHEANCRATHLHQQSASLTRRFGVIVIEDLKIRNMMRSARSSADAPGTNVAQKTGLNRSIGDVAWGRFAELLTYKAERAGGSVIRVNPRHTSNECSRCHAITPSVIGELFRCRKCGLEMDRDHNAALIIEHRGVVVPLAETA